MSKKDLNADLMPETVRIDVEPTDEQKHAALSRMGIGPLPKAAGAHKWVGVATLEIKIEEWAIESETKKTIESRIRGRLESRSARITDFELRLEDGNGNEVDE